VAYFTTAGRFSGLHSNLSLGSPPVKRVLCFLWRAFSFSSSPNLQISFYRSPFVCFFNPVGDTSTSWRPLRSGLGKTSRIRSRPNGLQCSRVFPRLTNGPNNRRLGADADISPSRFPLRLHILALLSSSFIARGMDFADSSPPPACTRLTDISLDSWTRVLRVQYRLQKLY